MSERINGSPPNQGGSGGGAPTAARFAQQNEESRDPERQRLLREAFEPTTFEGLRYFCIGARNVRDPQNFSRVDRAEFAKQAFKCARRLAERHKCGYPPEPPPSANVEENLAYLDK